ncbi:hypothetical protein ACFQ1M_04575 [Sungkyunkwania multivorans]|uniref:Uncharacterized protein n=1 Tax=Sungkyunkwania multivorans TaxID=1173618 RepID=A0ABW3CUM6_9FLAO
MRNIIPLGKGETKEVILLKGYELYFDSELKSKASVDFKEYFKD